MGLYRCAACGSPNVVTDTQSAGISYDYKKGIAGTVVLGTGGAVAGLQNKTQQVYKCPDCGVTLTYPMPQDIKMAIDLGVMSEEARHQIKLSGVSVNWEVLKKNFKNIESGPADQKIAEKDRSLSAHATATREEFERAIDLIVDYRERLWGKYTNDNPMSLSEYYEWQNAIFVFIENLPKYVPAPLPFELRGLHQKDIEHFFLFYIFEKIRLEYGFYPPQQNKSLYSLFNEGILHYANDNPFILRLANTYFTQKNNSKLWKADSLAQLATLRFTSRSLCLCRIKFVFVDQKGKESHVWQVVPRYALKSGKLYFHQFSISSIECILTSIGYKVNIEDYFSHFPEKRTEYDARIAARGEQLQMSEKIEKLKKEIGENEALIKAKNEEIDAYNRKIFGKKKALAQAEILTKEVQDIQKRNDDMKTELDDINSKAQEIPDDTKFYENLAKDMDWFLVWRCVDGTE